jgi:hypothetical protein
MVKNQKEIKRKSKGNQKNQKNRCKKCKLKKTFSILQSISVSQISITTSVPLQVQSNQ